MAIWLGKQYLGQFLSTLSLRRATHIQRAVPDKGADFYPRSPCGERPEQLSLLSQNLYFYPRSPCGERQYKADHSTRLAAFLSTLSLRRATQARMWRWLFPGISIHALLAESDPQACAVCRAEKTISIHALLAESDIRCGPVPGRL